MNEVVLILFYYLDFMSFSKLYIDVKINICKIMYVEWIQEDEYIWVFIIQVDCFLCNMVCVIVGMFLEVGCGKLLVDDFCKIIEQQNCCKVGILVFGNVFFLVNVEYFQEIFE